MPLERRPHYQGYFSQQDCSSEAFLSLISETLPLADLNFASAIEKNIPIYDTRIVDDVLRSSSRQELLAEWAYVIGERSGIVVLKQAILDLDAVDEATQSLTTSSRKNAKQALAVTISANAAPMTGFGIRFKNSV